ncbi:MAG: methyltransferase domain-containing protein [Myxococcales bacterium]|nr:methyltransferase domain-containing protein [Myxococcales bacterium]
MSNPETYYRDHWLVVEPERLEAYEKMFEWHPRMAPLLEPADLRPGQTVVDYGCGPGLLTLELARRVGPDGHVHGVDINTSFVERARRRLAGQGLGDRVTIHRIDRDGLPLPDAAADRVVCKNVLEYVDDPAATLAEFRRGLRSGGLAHTIDSDWGLLTVEPLGPEPIAELFEAARPAYRTPLIGRRLYGLFRAAGFCEVTVRVLAGADTHGRMLPILSNMASYARASGRMQDSRIDRILEDARDAAEAGTLLLLLPQFLVTGAAP